MFVVADGPRPEIGGEAAACAATRLLIEQIDWPCVVRRCFSDVNLGCGLRPASGIDWVFSQVDRAIILEDDCLPNPSFFVFCEQLLDKYANDPRVMHINGTNFSSAPLPIKGSYSFSKVVSCWGWATWRRAWRYHDPAVRDFPNLDLRRVLREAISHPRMITEFASMLATAHQRSGAVSYWDYQWALACWSRGGNAILPRENLVSNCGCGPDATHTFDEKSGLANLATKPIEFPLSHPTDYDVDCHLDRVLQRVIMGPSRKRDNLVRVGRVGLRGFTKLVKQVASRL